MTAPSRLQFYSPQTSEYTTDDQPSFRKTGSSSYELPHDIAPGSETSDNTTMITTMVTKCEWETLELMRNIPINELFPDASEFSQSNLIEFPQMQGSEESSDRHTLFSPHNTLDSPQPHSEASIAPSIYNFVVNDTKEISQQANKKENIQTKEKKRQNNEAQRKYRAKKMKQNQELNNKLKVTEEENAKLNKEYAKLQKKDAKLKRKNAKLKVKTGGHEQKPKELEPIAIINQMRKEIIQEMGKSAQIITGNVTQVITKYINSATLVIKTNEFDQLNIETRKTLEN